MYLCHSTKAVIDTFLSGTSNNTIFGWKNYKMKKDIGMADYETQEFHTPSLQDNLLFFGVKYVLQSEILLHEYFLKINMHAHTHVENAQGLTQKTEYLQVTATNCH